ncbi:MAG: hypothetical protein M1830_000728 [Pleopsidium flavum]|nr:MAG: hypothetical protein M1830_000728 [Pleopsidium flavum]
MSVAEIQDLLEVRSGAWARVPRTYIVLRLVNKLALLDQLIKAGFTDYGFPIVKVKDLPGFVGPPSKSKIMKAQSAVLTKSIDLERGKEGSHVCFEPGEPLPYEVKAILGAGGFGQVDKVPSLISYKEYARKLIVRRALYPTASATMYSFVNELANLKRVNHRHMVALVGGHTACSSPHFKYTNLRLPVKNVLCPPGTGAFIVSGSFDCSAVLVGAMSVGIMRAAFDAALTFAKGDNRRGASELLTRQAVADLLSGIKMQTEACRALTWKAANCLEHGPGNYNARFDVIERL